MDQEEVRRKEEECNGGKESAGKGDLWNQTIYLGTPRCAPPPPGLGYPPANAEYHYKKEEEGMEVDGGLEGMVNEDKEGTCGKMEGGKSCTR